MAKFSFFSFNWLGSEERKQKKAELELKQRELDLKEKTLLQLGTKEQLDQDTVEATRAYRSVRLIGKTCLVVLNDGTTLSKEEPGLLEEVRKATDEASIIEMFTKYDKYTDREEEKEEHALVVSNIGVLKGHEDFLIQGENVYLKGVNLVIPPVVLSSFIELVEKIDGMYENIEEGCTSCDIEELEEQYEALKMFWRWTSLNPIENSREDLIRFVKENDITITANGLLVCYRRVVKKGGDNHELIGFISNQYAKLKKWKKAPKNYWVWKDLTLTDYEPSPGREDECEGNLEELYLDLPNMQKHSFTDNHTRRKNIVIGSIYKEDEDKIDTNNLRDCSSGLHCGSKAFGFDGFGDVGVIVLVNPMYVRSVPVSDAHKMRVSEMYILNIADLEEYSESVEKAEITDYSNEYCSQTLEELEQMIKDKKIDKISCQDNLPAISIVDVEAIRNMLKDRIIEI